MFTPLETFKRFEANDYLIVKLRGERHFLYLQNRTLSTSHSNVTSLEELFSLLYSVNSLRYKHMKELKFSAYFFVNNTLPTIFLTVQSAFKL